MQTEPKHLYKMAAQESGIPEDELKAVGTKVFLETSEILKRPPHLIINVQGLGRWILRRKRINFFIEVMDNQPEENKILMSENRQEILECFRERTKEYDLFVEKRAEVRKLRDATQELIETGKDNPGEHKSNIQS